jgi:hypothetical protein
MFGIGVAGECRSASASTAAFWKAVTAETILSALDGERRYKEVTEAALQ